MQLGVGRVQVSRWRERYAQSRLAGIERDLPRGAPPATVDVARLVELTTQSKPAAATHWSTRTMAALLGISAASVSRHWRANGLKPHLMRGFKVSRDPKFVEKLEDIVGLYMSPPEHALVLCCDEKSQVQALDRTQPGLPMKKGRAATMTHDYHQAAAPWGVHQRAGIGHRHRRVHRPSQHQSQAIHLDQDCARHLAKSHSRQ